MRITLVSPDRHFVGYVVEEYAMLKNTPIETALSTL
jgi:hypothetical protein